MTDRAVQRRRRALYLFFFLNGIAMSSWVTRTPDIRDRLGVSTAQMGLVLFGLSVGSMTGILCSGRLVSRFGTRPVTAVGTLLIVASVAVVGAGSALASAPLVTAGLCLFGVGAGAGEVAINVDGADVERITGRPVLPTLHGCFSLGTVVGALAGMAATAAAFPAHWHLSAVAVVAAGIFTYAIGAVPAGTGIRAAPPAPGSAGPSKPQVWRDRRLLLIGAIVLAMALAEGAANDWLPLLMVDGHGLDAAAGSLVYVGFAAAMTLGRFGGTFFLSRHSRATSCGPVPSPGPSVCAWSSSPTTPSWPRPPSCSGDWARPWAFRWPCRRRATRGPPRPPGSVSWRRSATSPSWWGRPPSVSWAITTGCVRRWSWCWPSSPRPPSPPRPPNPRFPPPRGRHPHPRRTCGGTVGPAHRGVTSGAVWVGIGAVLTVTYAMLSGGESVTALELLMLAGIVGCVIGLKVLD